MNGIVMNIKAYAIDWNAVGGKGLDFPKEFLFVDLNLCLVIILTEWYKVINTGEE